MNPPDYTQFKKWARRGNLIAVTETIAADLETPVSSFLKLAQNSRDAFLLESAEQDERIGRYSIIGLSPSTILYAIRGKVIEKRRGRTRVLRRDAKLVDALEDFMKKFKLANPESVPGFAGGLVGYLGYESVESFEDIRLSVKPGPRMPEGLFFLTQDFLIFDHFRKQMTLVALAEIPKNRPSRAHYQNALRRIRRHIRLLEHPLSFRKHSSRPTRFEIHPHITREHFEHNVRRIKEYIRAGDCIQAVLSQRFSLRGHHDDFKIYRALRSINPSPYMFYFRCGKLRLIGSSPELLVKKTGAMAEVRPIAGTRPRGLTQVEDARLEDNMKKSPKEIAEHLMLVDLGRNDLGRVCRFDTIHVKNFARVERYSHVMHLVSDVIGRLKSAQSPYKLLKATFPAGTVSGAPKIRAMQIIDELEPERRGPYAGCVGYFGFNRDMDMCITIRTIMADGKNLYLQAGAGIVKDSDPKREYLETVNKARALLKAVREQGKF